MGAPARAAASSRRRRRDGDSAGRRAGAASTRRGDAVLDLTSPLLTVLALLVLMLLVRAEP